MATVIHVFRPAAAVPKSPNGGRFKTNAGSNFPVPAIAFDASTDQTVYYTFHAVTYGSGNLTLDIFWYADTASSGNVVWQAQVAAITPDTDTQDIETKAFATLNFVQDTHLGTTGQRLHKATITISNLDSIATGDYVCLLIGRDADGTNATDDLTGDAFIVMAKLSYSDA